MKRILYLFCLLAFIACSDDDNDNGNEVDNVMNDFDKPFSTLSSDELVTIMEENISASLNLEESAIKYADQLLEPLNYYCNINAHGGTSDLFPINLNHSPASEFAPFVGIKSTWNSAKKALDMTVNSNHYFEYFCPSSLTDDSHNDLHAILNREVLTSEYHFRTDVYKDDQLIYYHVLMSDRNNYAYKIMKTGPYEMSSKDVKEKETILVQHEGGCKYVCQDYYEGKDWVIVVEFNKIRVRLKYLDYQDIRNKIISFDENDESYQQKVLDLMNANIVDAVVVFTDRNEKVGDVVLAEFNWDWYGEGVYACRMKDGTEYRFSIDLSLDYFARYY